jgi:hypothetical protein
VMKGGVEFNNLIVDRCHLRRRPAPMITTYDRLYGEGAGETFFWGRISIAPAAVTVASRRRDGQSGFWRCGRLPRNGLQRLPQSGLSAVKQCSRHRYLRRPRSEATRRSGCVIMIRCPQTGREIPTGIEMDTANSNMRRCFFPRAMSGRGRT